jgi:hypothetical protein
MFWIYKILDRLFSDGFVEFQTMINFLSLIDMKGGDNSASAGGWGAEPIKLEFKRKNNT